MVQIVFAESVHINTVITKQARKFKTLACKAKGGVFSPKLEGKGGNGLGDISGLLTRIGGEGRWHGWPELSVASG